MRTPKASLYAFQRKQYETAWFIIFTTEAGKATPTNTFIFVVEIWNIMEEIALIIGLIVACNYTSEGFRDVLWSELYMELVTLVSSSSNPELSM